MFTPSMGRHDESVGVPGSDVSTACGRKIRSRELSPNSFPVCVVSVELGVGKKDLTRMLGEEE